MNEQHVAFHEVVTFLSWKDSSGSGSKITVGLNSRADLEHFDKATRRKGKKAGQRYQAAVQEIDEDEAPEGELITVDLWFAGANWAHQEGARVTFTVDEEDLGYFADMDAKDQGSKPSRFWLTLVQIDEDEVAINQAKADRLEAGTDSNWGDAASIDSPETAAAKNTAAAAALKGAGKAAAAAILADNDEFQWYVADKLDETREENIGIKASHAEADAFIKAHCRIESKAELDHDADAWARFVKLKRKFMEFSGAA